MAGFTPPPGQDYVVPATTYDKLQTFNSGFASTPTTVTTPAVPGSGTAATNTTGVNVLAYLSGGTISSVVVNGGTIISSTANGQSLTVEVPATQTILVNYTAAPTWVWKGI